MSNHKYQTRLAVGVDGDLCGTEYNATVHYHRHPAYNGGSDEPSSAAHCEVVMIVVHRPYPAGDEKLPDWIVDGLESALQPVLMEDWADDSAAAVEYRAEQRADDRMMERLS